MNQSRMILVVATVAVVSGAIWIWNGRPQLADATLVRAKPFAPVPELRLPAQDHVAASDLSPAPPSSRPAEPVVAASDGNQSTTSVVVVDPPSVDAPEPAERRFASGGHAESNLN
jgi:hypothetical protein